MKIALVYPPSCDPTAPYLAVPMLTGFLRAHGVEVLPIDANIEAWDALLRPAPLGRLRDRLERRIARLERLPSLDHASQLSYRALWEARGDAHAVPHGIAEAVATLRDPVRFYDPPAYARAVDTVDAALRVVSATHAPLQVDFTAYRTPFALTTPEEIAHDAEPENDPFDRYVERDLVPRLLAARVDAIGISVCFPGQLQPAYAFGLKLKRALPEVHLTVGGPGITQLLIRLRGRDLARALGPFDTAVVFEGEHTLLSLCRALDEKRPISRIPNLVQRDALLGARYLPGEASEDMRTLPAPDFAGLPIGERPQGGRKAAAGSAEAASGCGKYFAPHLTLPYDPTRGCYWGKCTFCHYGLAETGTASYRERAVATVVEHLTALSERFRTRWFYLSQDSVAPKTLVQLAQALGDANLDLRWATDLKPEKYLTRARAEVLRRGGAVACALGVESASERVLSLIDKGAPVQVVRDVVSHLADAQIAVEAMCFTDFPTETFDEALETLDFLAENEQRVAGFIVGEFDLTHGALVARDPGKFGLIETWQLDGDLLGTGLFYEERVPAKRGDEPERLDRALDQLSSGWRLRRYPWAGSLSTAHTVFYYARFGSGVLRELAQAGRDPGGVIGARPGTATARFDLAAVDGARDREMAIWHQLVRVRRHVSRAAWRELAGALPSLAALGTKARAYRFVAGEPPVAVRRPARGRRPSGAPNSLG
ncbi:MAG: B12-binding domain-containing radical SAM protein [Myxococcales bacterium]|nr:B12-binding domain-containing radical SAM protein [Myxococcales bacterium]